MNPEHPVYIVSKGRADSAYMTWRALGNKKIPFWVVIEEQEFDAYAAVVGAAKLLVLDPAYQREYDTCDEYGDTKGKGPGPARNFAWDHAAAAGAAWHWVMDDNIGEFYRLNHNAKIPVADGTVFRCMESFVERYENVAMAGPTYESFVKRRDKVPPLVLNTRIYSCNLIRNDVPYRWRARYNEDTDLSLRMLKDGWCTVQFNAFLQKKTVTQRVSGGNTDEFYLKEGTLPKSEMLSVLHPDVSRTVFKFNRWHHQVDYSRFRGNRLLRKEGVVIPAGVDNFGMVLQRKVDGGWVPA